MNKKTEKEISQNKQTIKLRWLIFSPFVMFYKNFKTFIFLSIPFAFFMTILALLLNNGIVCGVDYFQKQTVVSCAPFFSWTSLIFQIIRLLVIISYIRTWYNYAISKRDIHPSKLYIPGLWHIKMLLILLFIVFLNILPSISYTELLFRVPNPNWLIESLYFAVISLGFFIPIIAILYYYVITYIIEETKFPPFGQMIAKAFDNATIIMISTLFITTCGLFVVAYYLGKITPLVTDLSIPTVIVVEVAYNIIILAFTTLVTNYMFNLRDNLFPKE